MEYDNLATKKYKGPATQRLRFVTNFVDSFGMNRDEVLKMSGINYSTFSNWIKTDDIMLSNLNRLCRSLGYRCDIYIEPKDSRLAEDYRRRCLHTNQDIREVTNVCFLVDFIELNRLSKATVCYKLGLTRGRMNYYLNNNDILLSRVHDICKAFDQNLHIVIHPIAELELPEEAEVICETYVQSTFPLFSNLIEKNENEEARKPRRGRPRKNPK